MKLARVLRLRLALGLAAAGLAAGFGAVPGGAAGTAPSAITGTVSVVTPTSATLNGTVDPNGATTSWSFEYGTTTAYGSQTTAASAGAGTTDAPVSVTVDGLAPGTTYHYRLDATSSAGTTDGADGIFTTSSPPGAVTEAATSLTATTATLNGTVDPNGEPTTYSFQYGRTTSYGSSTASASAGAGTAAITVSAPIAGLTPSQTYHFRLVATSQAGTTLGPDMTLALTAPPSVSTGTATSLTATSARLNGVVDPNGQATSWEFEYGTTTSYGSTTAAGSAGSGTQPLSVSATVSGLSLNTVYHFRLVATNGSGTTAGADASLGSAVPPIVQTGSAENAGPTSVTLTGSVDAKGIAASWYFEYGTTAAYGSSSVVTDAGASSSAHTVTVAITKLSPATTYHYRIVASSSAGTSDGADVTFTTPPAVTVVAETSQSVYGRLVTLSGTATGSPAGTKVTVLAEPLGQTAFVSVATVTTQTGGSWSFQARPAIATSYEAATPSGTSAAVTIGVRPAITLRLITGGRLLIRVVAPSSLAGRLVEFQRLLPRGGWSTVVRRRLSSRSAATVAVSVLPLGTSTVRVAMSINQAGRGLLGGFSRTLSVTRT